MPTDKSKGTHGQTRRLSKRCNMLVNLQLLVKAVKTSWVHTVQSLARLLFQYGDGLGLHG